MAKFVTSERANLQTAGNISGGIQASSYADVASLPETARDGTLAFTEDGGQFHIWDGTQWVQIGSSATTSSVPSRDSVSVTRYGNAQITSAQSKFGGSSVVFDGTGDYFIATAALNSFTSSGDAITIECWVRPTSTASGTCVFALNGLDGSNQVLVGSAHVYVDETYNAYSTACPVNNWSHIAYVGNGSSNTIYVNGNSVFTWTTTYPAWDTCSLAFGAEFDSANMTGAGNYFNGWVDEVRVSNIERYNSSFTPESTAFTNDSDTTLLLHLDSDFSDDTGTTSTGGSATTIDVDYLIVAGGGGGAGDNSGGGGAGGLIYTQAATLPVSETITVTVGGGGSGGPVNTKGTNGQNSVLASSTLGTLTAVGGGASGVGESGGFDGNTGGSGGGGASESSNGTGGSGTSGQGNAGGNGGSLAGGGGGGAGASGTDGTGNNKPGNGGDGLAISITGTSTYYAGGGGAGAENLLSFASGYGLGGAGGGGAGGVGTATSGTTNTGGGGGGASYNGSIAQGGNGGSGVVIIRTTSTASVITGSPALTTDGDYNIYKFTGSGSITF